MVKSHVATRCSFQISTIQPCPAASILSSSHLSPIETRTTTFCEHDLEIEILPKQKRQTRQNEWHTSQENPPIRKAAGKVYFSSSRRRPTSTNVCPLQVVVTLPQWFSTFFACVCDNNGNRMDSTNDSAQMLPDVDSSENCFLPVLLQQRINLQEDILWK